MTQRASTRVAGLVLIVALAVVAPGLVSGAAAAPPPDAGSAQAAVDAARRESASVAQKYFAQLDRYEVIGSEIAATEQRMAGIRTEADGLRAVVARRAVQAYKSGAGNSFAFVIDGGDINSLARGTKLLAVANARDDHAVEKLRSLSEDLSARRAELEANRKAQSAALDELRSSQQRVQGNLTAALADQQTVVTRLAAQAAADRAAAQAVAAAKAAKAAKAPAGSTPAAVAAASRRAAAPAPAAPAPVVGYTPTPGSSSYHDDPFLVCTRTRESHGNYSVVNPSGPYLGAYQFLQSTWNITAQHAGRSDLVGVPPNQASPADQDLIAWTLYQWQGNGPWGGMC